MTAQNDDREYPLCLPTWITKFNSRERANAKIALVRLSGFKANFTD
jgi:hypothetical protein